MIFKRLFTSRLPKLFAAIFLSGLIVLGASWLYVQNWLRVPLTIPSDTYSYELTAGKSLSHMANDLAQAGVLVHPRLLRLYARILNSPKIHAGEYRLERGLTPISLLEKLKRGDVVLYQATIVEGWTLAQAVKALAKHPAVESTLADKTAAEQLALLALPPESLEGWIFPDTYSFSRNTSDVEILRNAYARMESHLAQAWAQRAENLPYKTPYEALIMASIVERETGHHSERAQIAGVFVRRLQLGMKLQTDPTVIYGMGDGYKGRITKKDLTQASAYNTYVIDGLPPTPIALPSAASLEAALHPAEGSALYFVARGDGTSEFSATLSAHNAAVRHYQLQRRKDYRAAPPVAR
jgi:UPF0755 protein